MSKKSILFAAAAGLVTLAGGVTAASAHGHGGGGHGGGHHNFFHHGFGPRIFVGGGYGYSDCEYLYSRWQYTGSRYWRHRYFQCRNGW
jgi:hypothetical protein